MGYTAINLHFADGVAVRLELKRFSWLAGGDHRICSFRPEYGCPENGGKFITQEKMRDIVLYATDHKLDVIPSISSDLI